MLGEATEWLLPSGQRRFSLETINLPCRLSIEREHCTQNIGLAAAGILLVCKIAIEPVLRIANPRRLSRCSASQVPVLPIWLLKPDRC